MNFQQNLVFVIYNIVTIKIQNDNNHNVNTSLNDY